MSRQQEMEAIVRLLVAEMMLGVASGHAPDALRDLDSMQAVRIARLIAPRVLALTEQRIAEGELGLPSKIKTEEP